MNNSFRVTLNGHNFLLATDEGTRRLGFYATRFVTARDSIQAEEAAVEMIRNDEQLRHTVLNPLDDPPKIYVTDVQEVESTRKASGFTFYPDENVEGEPDTSTRPN